MGRKLKNVNYDNHNYVQFSSEKGEQLSVREAYALTCNLVPGLLPVIITPKGKKFNLAFDITGYIPLINYLKSGLRKHHFASLLANTYSTLQDFQERYFNVSSVILDHNYVFIDPTSKGVRFLFIPIQLYEGDASIREFYMRFAENTLFSQNENLEFLDEYKSIVSRGINMSFFELEQFISSLNENVKTKAEKRRCNKCNAINDMSMTICVTCGKRLYNEDEKLSEYEPLRMVDKVTNKNPVKQYQPKMVCQKVSHDMPDEQVASRLIRKRTGQVFSIIKPLSVIGNRDDCDCPIMDNPLVSRNHAELRYKEGRFYIVDLFSTNKTRVDGHQIQSQKEVEIGTGSIITFGNEDFELITS